MNANQIVSMVVRMVMKRVIRSGVNAGIDAVGKRMNRNSPDADHNAKHDVAETEKRAKQTIRMARRLR